MSKGKKQAIYQLSQCLFSNHMLIEQQPTWIWNTYNNMILSVACTEINWLTRFKCRAHIYKTWTITMWTSKTTGSLTYISLMQLHEVNILNMTYIYMHKISSLSYSTQCVFIHKISPVNMKVKFSSICCIYGAIMNVCNMDTMSPSLTHALSSNCKISRSDCYRVKSL